MGRAGSVSDRSSLPPRCLVVHSRLTVTPERMLSMRTRRFWTAPLAMAAILAAVSSAEAQWGSISGKVVLDGAVPELKPLVKMGDAAAKDAAVCAAQTVPNESLVVDPDTK